MERHGAALPRKLVVALGVGGALLLAQLVVLVLSFAQIKSTEDHVAATDAKATAAFEAIAPVAREASERLDDAKPLAETVAPVARDAARLLAALGGESEELQVLLDSAPGLSAGFRGISAALIPVLRGLDPLQLAASVAQISPTLHDVNALVDRLADGDRLIGVLDRARSVLGEIERLELVRRAVQADHTLRRVLAVQNETLDVQRRSLAVQLRSLRVQRQSLDHVRSLDEKTGGDLLSP